VTTGLILAPLSAPPLELYEYPLIIAVGILSGFINTVAGGGSLITLPLLIFLFDLPGSVANATNRIAILAQSSLATAGFRSKGIKLPTPYIYYLAGAAVAGGFIGANLAIAISDQLFNRILAVIMIVVVILTVRNGNRNVVIGNENLSLPARIFGVFAFLFIGMYGGFLQAGIGFVIIALFNGFHRFSLTVTNFIKVFLIMLLTIVAVVVFAVAGEIRWEYGIMLAIGQGIGGWYASRWSVSKDEKWIKAVIVVMVVVMAVKLWFF